MRKLGQKGFTAVEGVLVVLLLAALGAAGYFAYEARQAKSGATEATAQTAAKKDTPQNTVVTEATYSVTLPDGWKKASAPDGEGNYYRDTDGNYFSVQVDPPGREFISDDSWELSLTSDGYKYSKDSSMESCNVGEGPFCAHGDSKYSLAMNNPDDEALKGHTYFFMAGNTQKEDGVSTDVYKQIIESFKAK